jgi:hypothetical protein
MRNRGASGTQAFVKPVEAVFAYVAAQGNHANAAQQEVEQSAVRPSDVGFMALGTFNSHRWQSPVNL